MATPYICSQLKTTLMAISNQLSERNNGICELCNTATATVEYAVSPRNADSIANLVAICDTCAAKMKEEGQGDYWRCLEGSIWSPEESVQALSYRLLHTYQQEDWAADVLNSVTIDDNTIQWALSAFEQADEHRDTSVTN